MTTRTLSTILAVWTTCAYAADGTWTNDANANWATVVTEPWLDGIVAEGIDATADFGSINITAARTVTLTNSLTIGYLKFGDTVPSHDWTLKQSNGAVLSLQTGSDTPTITVSNRTVVFDSMVLAGTQGFVKAGSGTLQFKSSKNTYTGPTAVSGGTLDLAYGSSSSTLSSNDITIASGAILNVQSSLALTNRITGAGRIAKNNGTAVLSLFGNNDHTGGTTLGDGYLVLGTANAIGTGTLTINGGRLMSSDNTARTLTNTLSFGSNNTQFGDNEGGIRTGDLTFTDTNSHSLGGGSAKQWQVRNDTTVTFNNNWTGNSGWTINKVGSGTLVFNGNIGGNFNGAININEGTFIFNGAYINNTVANVTVASGAMLGGDGTIGTAVNFSAGGTFLAIPGATLDITGAVSAVGGMIATKESLTEEGYTVLTHTADALDGAFTVDDSVTDQGYGVSYESTAVRLLKLAPTGTAVFIF